MDTATVVRHRKQVFWESYLLDRFSSSILGRPFAVEDEAIDVAPDSSSGEVFNHLLQMGRITSDMHNAIYHPTFRTEPPHTSSSFGKIKDPAGLPSSMNALFYLRKFHSQLRNWSLEAPTFEAPTCVYEKAEFSEMILQESRLSLFRAVIHELPESQLEIKRRLSVLCHVAAQRILECFSSIKGNNLLSHNRSLARLILISGLMIISTAKMQDGDCSRKEQGQSHSEIDVDFWLDDIASVSSTYSPDPTTSFAALDTCEESLTWLASSMPEVSTYARLFRRLRSTMGTTLLPPPAHESEETNVALSHERLTASVHATEMSQHYQSDGRCSDGQADLALWGRSAPTMAHSATTSAISGQAALESTLNIHTFGDLGCELSEDGALWSLSNEPWMEGIEGDLSGLIWDTTMPWQWSPSTNM